MVGITQVQIPRKQSFGELAGQSFAGGFGQGVQTGINQKLNEMYEEKQYQKNLSRQKELNKEQFKGITPYLEEHGFSKSAIKSLQESGLGIQEALPLLKSHLEHAKITRSQEYAKRLHESLNAPRTGGTTGMGAIRQNMAPEMEQPESAGNHPFMQNYQPGPEIPQALKEAEGAPVEGEQEEEPIRVQLPKEMPMPDTSRFEKVINRPIALNEAPIMQKEAERRDREIARMEKKETDISNKYILDLEESREPLMMQENALQNINRALDTDGVNGLDSNYFSEVFNAPWLANVPGVELWTNVKELALNDIRSVGSKAMNQMLEKNIFNMNPQIGRGKWQNKAVVATIRSTLDYRRKKLEIADELRNYYNDKIGFVPSDISQQVEKRAQIYNRERQELLAYEIDQIRDEAKSDNVIYKMNRVSPGTMLTAKKLLAMKNKWGMDREATLRAAQKLGYEIPSDEIVNRAQK